MESLKVQEFMRLKPVCFTPDMSIAAAVEALANSSQSGGPVLDNTHKVVGYLCERECIDRLLDESYYSERVDYVRDVMIQPDFTILQHESMLELAQKMLDTPQSDFVVIDEDKLMQGLITRSDVLKALASYLRAGYAH